MTTISLYSETPVAALGLRTTIEAMGEFALTSAYPSLDFFEENARRQSSDLLVLEVSEKITFNVIQRISTAAPASAIILWVRDVPSEFLSQALELGVLGLLSMNSTMELHADCFREVVAGRLWVDQNIGRGLVLRDRVALTRRERQLMGLVAQGLRNKEIAWSLGIAEGTVKVYMSRLFMKVGVHDRLDLALLAFRNLGVNGGGSGQTGVSPDDRSVSLNIPRLITRRHSRETSK